MNIKYSRKIENRYAVFEKKIPRIVTVSGIMLILIIWEIASKSGLISELYLPSPTSILLTSQKMLISGELLINLKASLYRIIIGFLTGSIAGVLAGLIIGFSKIAESIGNPIVYSIYPIPKIALLPLIILWLGIGEVSKISIISLGVFFPVVINTYSGVKSIDKSLLKVAISFKTSRLNIIMKVILPGALPMIFAGLKLAAGTSLLLLIAAEMIAAKEGIGSMILHYGDLMLTTKLMVGIITLSILGVLFTHSISWIEKIFIKW